MVAAGFVVKYLSPGLEIAGFVVLAASALWAVSSYRRMAGVLTSGTGGRSRRRDRRPARRANGGFMERLDARWQRRRESGR